MSFQDGTGCGRRAKCDVERAETQAASVTSAAARPTAVGSRRTIIELTEADIRRLVGAPDDALVQVTVTEARDLGPNGRLPATVTVSWKDGAR